MGLRAVVLGLLLLAIPAVVFGAISQDAVDPLTWPGWNKPLSFNVYSGHLPVKIATGPAAGTYYVHYQFQTSQRNPTTDPVVLWQNGGPGASSIFGGLYNEMGFFMLDQTSLNNMTNGIPNLKENPWSWNKVSSMLYFDHPPGVGFSYCVDANNNPIPCPTWNDYLAAELLYSTIDSFFAGFSELVKNEFFIFGESYAGIYIPSTVTYYTQQVDSGNAPAWTLTGFSVGNGCINIPGANPGLSGICNGWKQMQYTIDQFYDAGFYSKDTYDQIYQSCSLPILQNTATAACQAAIADAVGQIGQVNAYMIYDTCNDQLATPWNLVNYPQLGGSGLRSVFPQKGRRVAGYDALKPKKEGSQTNQQDGGIYYTCWGNVVTEYFQFPSVLSALHINGTYSLSAFSYNALTFSSYDNYPNLIARFPILIYNGDVDTICPLPANQDWIDEIVIQNMSLPVAQTNAPWTIPTSIASAGLRRSWTAPKGHRFSLATLRGAGHEAPHYVPQAAFQMFFDFITNKTL